MPAYDSYLAANTPQGFVSRFDQLNRERLERLYIIKGTSGNGKSTFMRHIAERMEKQGELVERIHCSADSSSLDGLLIPELGVALLDGTAPHTVEPRWPFAFETVVELFSALDGEQIYERREEVFRASAAHRALLERAQRLIASAGALDADAVRLQDACIDRQKLRAAAFRLSRKLFGRSEREQGGEEIRFLSAIGGETFWNAVTARCEQIFVLEEDVGAARHFLAAVRNMGRAAGQPVVTFMCPMRPADRIEHLVFPQAGIGFVTSNTAHRFPIADEKRINCRRFVELSALRRAAPQLTFDRRVGRGLLRSAVETLRLAKEAHDRLENIYTAALRPEVLTETEEKLARELSALPPATDRLLPSVE